MPTLNAVYTIRPPRISFIDDEPNIRLTLPAILEMRGFDQIVTAAIVADGLRLISLQPFDVLISDLNIGELGNA
jgi:DNA-binding response OmpR family regulator